MLPPWGRLYHWKHTHRGEYFPWRSFFDIKSLSKWTPVIEFEDYLKGLFVFILLWMYIYEYWSPDCRLFESSLWGFDKSYNFFFSLSCLAEGPKIQEVYMLQHYVEGWTGEWVVKYDRRPCLEEHNFRYIYNFSYVFMILLEECEVRLSCIILY